MNVGDTVEIFDFINDHSSVDTLGDYCVFFYEGKLRGQYRINLPTILKGKNYPKVYQVIDNGKIYYKNAP